MLYRSEAMSNDDKNEGAEASERAPSADAPSNAAEMHEPAVESRRPGATNTWTRSVPLDLEGATRSASAAASTGIQHARRAAGALSSTVRSGAGQLADGVSRGAGRVGAAFEAPADSEVGALLGEANLPELTGDPLEALARRLDREADLWRELSLRALARAAWSDRVAQTAAVGAWLVTVATALVGLFSVLFGGPRSMQSVLLVLASIACVLAGTGIVAWVSASVRRTQGALAGAALERADLAELRLQRLGVVLALRHEDVSLFHRALARLESDTRGGA